MLFYTNVQVLGDTVLFRGFQGGRRRSGRVKLPVSLWTPTPKTTEYTALDGRYLQKLDFLTVTEAREFVKQYKEVDNFEIFGNQNFEYVYICENFPGKIDWDINNILIANIDLEWGSENGFASPETALEPVTAITIKLNDKIYAFGCGAYTPSGGVLYRHCKDEYELLEEFLKLWTSNYPDIITGWHTTFADIPYLYNRLKKLFGEDKAKTLSPWKMVWPRTVTLMGKDHAAYDIVGIGSMDYLELYRKFAPGGQARESYKLDYICSVEIGEKKLSYDEHGSLHLLYKNNFQKFMDYNVRDVLLVDKLDQKLRLISLALTLAYDSKSNYNDVFKQTRMWDNIIYNWLWEKNIIIPPKKFGAKGSQFRGAAVKDPQLGRHYWVVSFDLTSLYPHLQMQYNLSPETLMEPHEYPFEIREMMKQDITVDTLLEQRVNLEALKKHELTITPNKQIFRTDFKGFIPDIIEKMFSDRKMYKKKMLECEKELEENKDKLNPPEIERLKAKITEFDNFQQNKKICLNSCFGASGNPGFRYYDVRQAEAITTSGQLAIRWIQKKVNEYLNKLLGTENGDYVIASDTDSIYLCLDKLVLKAFNATKKSELPETEKVISFINKVCEAKIQPFIDKSYEDLASYVNAYDQKMIMKREKICDVGLCMGAKHYIWNVWDSEGIRYAKPKAKVVGLEMIKSNTPEVCRNKLKQTLDFIIDEDEKGLQEFIADFKEDWKKLPIADIATPTGMKGIDDYGNTDDESLYRKGTPIHVKASLIYNQLVKSKGLERKYQLIQEGEKIKFAYLKKPNPLHEEVIGFPMNLPQELGMDNFIDKDRQFQKAFLGPLEKVLDVIHWKAEAESSLEDFFGG